MNLSQIIKNAKKEAMSVKSNHIFNNTGKMQINGRTINVPNNSSVTISNDNKVYINGKEYTENESDKVKEIKFIIEGQANITFQQNATILGNVTGNIQSNGSVSCNDVKGDITSKGSVSCDDVGGNVSTKGSISCDDVGGNVYK